MVIDKYLPEDRTHGSLKKVSHETYTGGAVL